MSRTYRFRGGVPSNARWTLKASRYVDSSVRSYVRQRDDSIYYEIAHVHFDFPCTVKSQSRRYSRTTHDACIPYRAVEYHEVRRLFDDILASKDGNFYAVANAKSVNGRYASSRIRRYYRKLFNRFDRQTARAILRDDRNWDDDCEEVFPDTPNSVDWECS